MILIRLDLFDLHGQVYANKFKVNHIFSLLLRFSYVIYILIDYGCIHIIRGRLFLPLRPQIKQLAM